MVLCGTTINLFKWLCEKIVLFCHAIELLSQALGDEKRRLGRKTIPYYPNSLFVSIKSCCWNVAVTAFHMSSLWTYKVSVVLNKGKILFSELYFIEKCPCLP